MNGLLLQPTLDHLFDSGLITFEDNGKIRISPKLSEDDVLRLGINQECSLRKVPEGLNPYLTFHRKNVFQHD